MPHYDLILKNATVITFNSKTQKMVSETSDITVLNKKISLAIIDRIVD